MSPALPTLSDITDALASGSIFVSVVLAVTVMLTSLLAREKRLAKENLEELQKTIAAKIAETHTESAKDISEKLPEGVTAEELEQKIASTVQTTFATLAKHSRESLDFVSELVNGYHQQALSQAKVQFWFSVLAAVVGFVYILVAASRTSEGSLSTVLNVLPGVVIDAVAFLFFRQAEQTRERATALYDRLRQDRQIENAREMVASIDDPQIRSLVKAQIALHMTGLKPKELDLQMPLQKRP